MAHDWKSLLVGPEASVRDALAIIDAVGKQLVIVVDADQRILGTVTDGDVRRSLLKGMSLESRVDQVMNKSPKLARPNNSAAEVAALMKRNGLRQIPVVDAGSRLIDLRVVEDLEAPRRRENEVVLMAGGMGKRLYPLTKDLPKPLIRVGDKPILEIILEDFIAHGFLKFTISVNYRAEMVRNHFGNGSKWGVDISYVEEEGYLGTAGSLGLLETKPSKPIIVMNGDLLTKVNFEHLLDFHKQQKTIATMCVRRYELQVPFGVVSLNESDHRILKVDEKPWHHFLVNAGIYVIEPDLLDLIPKQTPMDMTQLFEKAIQNGKKTAAFPIREYWMDIGRLDDLEKAQEYVKQNSGTEDQ